MKIFVAVHGQPDNIGDSVLRRAMLDAIRPAGSELHVLVGASGAAYRAGLALQPTDVVYASRKTWQLAGMRSAMSGTASFVSNAGEIQLNARRVKINLADLVLLALIRLRRGAAIQTGMGIRDTSRRRSLRLVAPALLCRPVGWRDAQSRDYARRGDVHPDWAFAIRGTTRTAGDHRDVLAVTMRGDRPAPDPKWLEAVRSIAENRGLTIVVVTQVARDSARSRELAAALEGTLLDYDGGSHADQEALVREVYSRSDAVVSDRLHALIMGVTEGATPVGLCIGADDKISRTFAGAGFAPMSVSQAAVSPDEFERTAVRLAQAGAAAAASTTTAGERLDELTSAVIAALSAPISRSKARK